MIHGEKDEYQIGFTADCEMHPEKCDSVLSLMKNTFISMAEDIDLTVFKSAKESLLKSLEELEKAKNGFWLDIIWKKESRGVDFYTERRTIIDELKVQEVVEITKLLLNTAKHSETLMQPD
jgi:hypothetical protein